MGTGTVEAKVRENTKKFEKVKEVLIKTYEMFVNDITQRYKIEWEKKALLVAKLTIALELDNSELQQLAFFTGLRDYPEKKVRKWLLPIPDSFLFRGKEKEGFFSPEKLDAFREYFIEKVDWSKVEPDLEKAEGTYLERALETRTVIELLSTALSAGRSEDELNYGELYRVDRSFREMESPKKVETTSPITGEKVKKKVFMVGEDRLREKGADAILRQFYAHSVSQTVAWMLFEIAKDYKIPTEEIEVYAQEFSRVVDLVMGTTFNLGNYLERLKEKTKEGKEEEKLLSLLLFKLESLSIRLESVERKVEEVFRKELSTYASLKKELKEEEEAIQFTHRTLLKRFSELDRLLRYLLKDIDRANTLMSGINYSLGRLER